MVYQYDIAYKKTNGEYERYIVETYENYSTQNLLEVFKNDLKKQYGEGKVLAVSKMQKHEGNVVMN